MKKVLKDLNSLNFPMHYTGVRLLASLLIIYDFEKLDYYYAKIGKNVGKSGITVQRDIYNAYAIAKKFNNKLPNTVNQFIKAYALGGVDFVS